MKRHTYQLEFACGSVAHRRTLAEARALRGGVVCDCGAAAEGRRCELVVIRRVALTADAFERAADGCGGYYEDDGTVVWAKQ